MDVQLCGRVMNHLKGVSVGSPQTSFGISNTDRRKHSSIHFGVLLGAG